MEWRRSLIFAVAVNVCVYWIFVRFLYHIHICRIETSGISAVGETPEKTHPAQRALQLSTLSKTKPSLGPEPSTSRIITETVMSPESSSGAEPEQRSKTGFASSGRGLDGSLKLTTPLKKSSQKQSAFTNYFQPVSKKRQVPYHQMLHRPHLHLSCVIWPQALHTCC